MTDWNETESQSANTSSREAGAPVGSGFFLNELEADMPRFDHPLCAEVDGEIFYPETGGSVRHAKSICARCDFQEPCLDWALEHHERFGVWGGATPSQRRKIAAERGITQERTYRADGPRTYTPEQREAMAERARNANRARVAKHRRNKAA